MTSKIYAIIFRFPTSGISSPTAPSASCQHESYLQSEVGGSDDYEFTDGNDDGSSDSDGDDGDGSSDSDGDDGDGDDGDGSSDSDGDDGDGDDDDGSSDSDGDDSDGDDGDGSSDSDGDDGDGDDDDGSSDSDGDDSDGDDSDGDDGDGSSDSDGDDDDGSSDSDGDDSDGDDSDGDDGDGSSDGDGFSDSDGFGDCGQSDGFERFDGVENLLLDENPISNDMFVPLYPGAAITICAAYCAIMTYATTNKLSYSAIETLLKLLHLLCPSSHQLPSSLYKLKKFFQQYTSSYEKKRICPSCHHVLKEGETCPRSHGQTGHMIQVPIEKALKSVVLSKLNHFLQYTF